MNREEARKNITILPDDEFAEHVLDSLDAIEKRMGKLENKGKSAKELTTESGLSNLTEGREFSKPLISPTIKKGDFDIDYNKVSEGMDKTWPQTEKEIRQLARMFNEHEPKGQEYRTMAEHIAQRPEGMTAEDARQDFIERCLANTDKLEVYAPSEQNYLEWLHDHDPRFTDAEHYYRLPLDADGNLPDYPLLACPEWNRDPIGLQAQKEDKVAGFYVAVRADYEMFHQGKYYSTPQASEAMWNKWMRERFGASYGEGE